jgi:hypothetical protein
MKATEVQQMLGVLDGEIILQGGLCTRKVVHIWFSGGKVVRQVSWPNGSNRPRKPQVIDRIEQEDFQLDILTVNLTKASRTNTNAKLVDLARAFGRPIPLV